MRQTVYIDVLIAVNFLVDYFLLYAAGQFSAAAISRTRLCLGALLGGCFSCSVLLPSLPFWLSGTMTLSVCALMTLTAFGFHSWRKFIRTGIYVIAVTVCYAGVMMAVWLFAAPRGLIVNNGSVYIDIPPGLLVLVTVVCYAAASLFSGLLRRRNLIRSRCRVTVKHLGTHVSVDAIVDTGNLLCEPFSGLPVIVAEYEAIKPVVPDGFDRLPDSSSPPPSGLRVIPYSGVGGNGILLAFRPDEITTTLPGCRPKRADAYIGILRKGHVGREHHAIVNPDVLL